MTVSHHDPDRSGSERRNHLGVLFVAVLASGLSASACDEVVITINDPDGSTPPWDGRALGDGGPFVEPVGRCVEPTGVDLLIVIDNSNSMAEEQAALASELPRLVERLVEPPDDDGDGERDWIPVEDLRVAVVTTDMGVGGQSGVPSCGNAMFGDDGRFSAADRLRCAADLDKIMGFYPAVDRPDVFAADVACLTTAGTTGCGFEQPLEAALKALSPGVPTLYTGPDYRPPSFAFSTRGHADGANAGFVRVDTLLAVLVVTDENDCSAADLDLFDPASAAYGATPLHARCDVHGGALHAIDRYAKGFLALRYYRPDLFAFAAIAGVPVEAASARWDRESYDALLADERMQLRFDPSGSLLPVCSESGRGNALPSRRLVQLARDLTPGRSSVDSICGDFDEAVRSVASLIGRRACDRYGAD